MRDLRCTTCGTPFSDRRDIEMMAAALVGSGLIERYREYAHAAHPGTMRPDMGAELSEGWAHAILDSLFETGYVLSKVEKS